MAQTLSIILAQYYPDKTQLRHTLDSLLIQDTYDFELIIADDGSPEDYWDDTRAYLAAHGFTNVKLSKNKVNQGTVTNMLHAVELASGQWIAGISPGDYVYDASTIRWVLAMLRKDAPQVAFGKSAYYRQESDGTLVQLPGETPFDRTPYEAAHYDNKAIRRNVLLYDDGISGIETMYERGIFLDALQKMNGRVRFAEDFATRLFAVQGVPIRCYDRILRWYEYGTGVSTNEKARARMEADWRAMLTLMRELYPQDRLVRLAWEDYHNDRHKSRLVRGLIGRLVVPQNCAFKKAQHSWQPPINGDMAELKKIYAYAEEDTHA